MGKFIRQYQKSNIIGDGDLSCFRAYCELERYLGRAYLAVSESYDWLKAHVADTLAIRLKNNIVRFNINILSNKIHSSTLQQLG